MPEEKPKEEEEEKKDEETEKEKEGEEEGEEGDNKEDTEVGTLFWKYKASMMDNKLCFSLFGLGKEWYIYAQILAWFLKTLSSVDNVGTYI